MSFKPTNEEAKQLNQSHAAPMLPVPTDHSKFEQNGVARTLLGRAVFVKGEITAKQDMHINGRVEGTISLKDNKLEIGDGGYIQANAFAKVIIISGELVGDAYASEQIIVTKTGRVIGDIYTADFCIEEGAHIKGNIDMQKQDIFKQHIVPEIQEEGHGKGSGFGFLFKKGREVPQAEVTTVQDLHDSISVSDELMPLAVENSAASTCPYSERSVLGESVIIKGELLSEEDVIIQGHIDGTIYFKNNALGVGTHSQIKGNIYVKSLVGHGEIRGDIYASDRVIIKKPGHVYGKIHAPRVSTEKGAVLMGSITMEPQNIEQIFASMGGSVTILEGPRSRENTEEDSEAHGNGSQQKNSAWPIFYPRS